MKTYLVSANLQMYNAVVSSLKQQHIPILQQMDLLGVLTISCTDEQKTLVKQIAGVLAVEEEGTSFAI